MFRLISSQHRETNRFVELFLLSGVLFLLPLLTLPPSAIAASETLYVKVRLTKLRIQPSHLASNAAVLAYGDSVEKLEDENGWFKVKARNSTIGFIHPSAVTEQKVILSSKGNATVGASSSDVVLAGKGFSKEVEKAYARKNASLNFRAVDEMERNSISEKELALFVREGKLSNQG